MVDIKHGKFICDNERRVDDFPRVFFFYSEQPEKLRVAGVRWGVLLVVAAAGVHKDPLLIRLDVCSRIHHNGSSEAKRADTTAAGRARPADNTTKTLDAIYIATQRRNNTPRSVHR